MAYCKTILSQILKLVPRHEFETLAKQHHSGRAFRTAPRWSQFVTMTMAQLSGRSSLRGIVENLSVQARRLYHLGSAKLSRLPEFVTFTEGKTHDVMVCRNLSLPKGSLVAVYRGYNDYQWYKKLTDKGIFFVTRLKSNAKNNDFKLSAKTMADIYKARWQVERFFKWIKQTLKIKSFVGTSKNAVMTQIWIAMCIYLLLALLKFQSQVTKSMQQILRLFQSNLFKKRDLWALLRGDPPDRDRPADLQLALL